MRMVVNGIEVSVTKKQSKICTSMSNRGRSCGGVCPGQSE